MLIHIAHSLCINKARYSLRIVRGFYTGSMLVFLLLVTAPFGDLIAQEKLSQTINAPEGTKRELLPLRYNHPGLVVDLGVGLWAWPIPCDADSDGDFDLIVSCPDKPSNGVWYFENRSGDTAINPMPVFQPAIKLSGTVHYVMPSYIGNNMRVLSPGKEYSSFTQSGIQNSVPLSVPANFYKPQGKQTKGPKVRHNQWRFADYDGDDILDLIVGVEDWSFYGWDDAWDRNGQWIAGPLRGFVYFLKGNPPPNSASPNSASPNNTSPANPSVQPEKQTFQPPVAIETVGGQPLETFGCPSPNLHDWDGDGDLDILCGEFLDSFTYFENAGSRQSPKYKTGYRLKTPQGSPLSMDLQMIVPVAFDWDRDGFMDLIVGDEDGRVAWVRNTGRLDSNQAPVFDCPQYFQQVAETLKCGALATPVGVDWDQDGDEDILSGNTAGYIEFFENLSGPNVESPKWQKPRRLEVDGAPFRIMAGKNGSIQGPAEAKWGYTTFSVADWDQDGKLDVVLNSILGQVVWLRNIGEPTAPRLSNPEPITVQWDTEPPTLSWGWLRPEGNQLLTQWRTTPVVVDFNRDGLVDLAMLDTEGYLAFFERYKDDEVLRLKPPTRRFLNEKGEPLQLNSKQAGGSGRRKLAIVDWNDDGHLDWLFNSKNAELWLQIPSNQQTDSSRQAPWHFQAIGPLSDRNIEGHDVSPTTIDLDGDGLRDFLGGAEDGRLYYMHR
jgi:hypothetical protein